VSREELDAVTFRLAERDDRDVGAMFEEFTRMQLSGEIADDAGLLDFLMSLRRNGVLKSAYEAYRIWQVLQDRPQRWYNVTLEAT